MWPAYETEFETPAIELELEPEERWRKCKGDILSLPQIDEGIYWLFHQ